MDMRKILRGTSLVAFGATVPLSLALVAGFFGHIHPALDALAHFRIHLAAALILLAPFLLLTPRLRWNGVLAVALGAASIFNTTDMAGLPGFGQVEASQVSGVSDNDPVYRLMQLNLRFNNPEPAKVLSLIGRIRPDVITLEEVSPMWADKLALLESAYPYRLLCSLEGHAGGVAILSLRPFADGSDGQCLGGGTLGVATVDFGGRPVDVAAMHLHWPWPFDQIRQIATFTPLLGSLQDTAILAGDLNATPWSAASADVETASGMQSHGPTNPTWIWRRLPEWLRFAGLPIDRIFAKGDVAVQSVRTLEPAGSDHLPVLLEFSLTPQNPEEPRDTTSLALAATP